MYKTWTGSATEASEVARALEAHLNEFADEIVSVSYAVGEEHCVLAVYRPIDMSHEAGEETAVAVAEQLLDQSAL